ncbi:putative metallopeptidase [Delftia acidovorans]|uniref:putative metallopeptidase n=1 Tax=Delftia acidovorans TaxID=80866 RepID=UPI0028A8D639|nr:putative metallopeptidase [Delftia acidovorans]
MATPAKAKPAAAIGARPYPPADLWRYVPAEGVAEWVQVEILADDGRIHNPDHAHLIDADLVFLWAPGGFTKAMKSVIAQAEEVMIRAGGWQKGRQEQQFEDWFGRVPAFMITLDASYCAQCSDADWCALVEHELYHITQALDDFGAPRFGKDGKPKLRIRGHDVEEFVGVVKRYGPSDDVRRLVDAANAGPELRMGSIAHACGTCLKVAA